VGWDALGVTGRQFVSGGPSRAQLSAFSGRPASTPIRVYAGLDRARTLDQAADAVVAELFRTRAFDRAVLAVATTSGTGWLDPSLTDSLEYLYNGDTAIASLQYADLPSWIDQVLYPGQAAEAGRVLFDRVHAAVRARPPDSRPRLVAFGESLGSYGGQAAFTSADDMLGRVDAALWEGTPGLTEPWRSITARRAPGTLQRLPVYGGGEHIRFAADADQLGTGSTWDAPRVVYLQHGSDPIVWWSPELLLHRPDWLREPHAPDVDSAVTWLPLITFLQLTGDLLHAYDVPPGHGHHYGVATADAWVAALQPPGWTTADTERLRVAVPPD
jgi:uncharacterized membrane protein